MRRHAALLSAKDKGGARRGIRSGRLLAICALGLAVLLSPTAARGQSSPPQQPVTSALPGIKAADMGHQIFAHLLLDQFEDRAGRAGQQFRWDGEGWFGTDMNRLWFKIEGILEGGRVSDGDQELLYDRPLPHLRYFDLQAGVREDLDSGPSRTWAAFGIEGLAPYFFQFAPTFYIGSGGRVAARVMGSYDVYLTQRLVATPNAELNFYGQSDPARGIGAGLSELDTGVRVRYEFTRKFAPYIGFAWNGKFGSTAGYARQAGRATSNPSFVFGLRFWF